MRIEETLHLRFLIPLMALLAAGCGGDRDPEAAVDTETTSDEIAAVAEQNGPQAAEASVEVPDACSFFDRAQLEQTIGWELREGEPEDMPPGSYACDFETPPLMYVTRTYPDPALPQSVGFGSLTVNTHPSKAQNFDEFRQTLGPAAEDVPDIGDGAYFYGFDMLYVRVGNRGFSLRIYTDAQSDEDRARVREVLLTLAREGASRLQGDGK